MRRLLLLLVALPLLVLGAPSASAQAATCTIDPQDGPVTGQVGTELTFFITVTGCASSNKQPSFKVVDGRLPPGTKLFDFAGSYRADQRRPHDRRELHVHGPGQRRDPRDRHRDLHDRDPPARGADDHHRGALQRNGRRVLLLWQPVRQRWGPALHLVGGRRGAASGLELPRRENTISGTPTTAGTFTFTVRVTDDLGAFSEKELSITIS